MSRLDTLTKPRRPANRRRIPEREVLRACTDLLSAKHIWWERMNAGDQFGSYKGKRWRKRGHRPGTADVLALPRITIPYAFGNTLAVLPLWIECKSPGEKQSYDQQLFQHIVEAEGHACLVVEDVDQLAAWLKERGL